MVYSPCNFTISDVIISSESQEYAACSHFLNQKKAEFRVAKTTPTKVGQFVTLWKRDENGVTQPFDESDAIDFVLIFSQNAANKGLFIFPKSVLIRQGIMRQNAKNGKRGIRIYPPWERTTSPQAQKTQTWQTQYFLMLNEDKATDIFLAKKLFGNV
jgi:hypothetical protein